MKSCKDHGQAGSCRINNKQESAFERTCEMKVVSHFCFLNPATAQHATPCTTVHVPYFILQSTSSSDCCFLIASDCTHTTGLLPVVAKGDVVCSHDCINGLLDTINLCCDLDRDCRAEVYICSYVADFIHVC